jgi:hypothetical protein
MRLVTDTIEFGQRATCRSGTRSRSAAITSARPVPPRPRSWPSPWRRHGVRALGGGPRAGRRRVRPAPPSSSTPTTTSSRRSPSSAPPGASGRGRCARRSARRTRARGCCASTPRPPGCRLTAQQPLNNVVRVAIQALAAVLGGTQSLHTNSLDEALALPSEEAVTVALRTQQIIAHESGVTNTVDPLGGSFFVEARRTRWSARRWPTSADRRDRRVLPALERASSSARSPRPPCATSARLSRAARHCRRQRVCERRTAESALLQMDVEGYGRQLRRLAEVRRSRDGRAVAAWLQALGQAARGRVTTSWGRSWTPCANMLPCRR